MNLSSAFKAAMHVLTCDLFKTEKKKRKTYKRSKAKLYDTKKFTCLEHDRCLREFKYWQDNHPKTQSGYRCFSKEQLAEYMNSIFGCNKSVSTYSRIYNGTTPRPIPRIDDIGK